MSRNPARPLSPHLSIWRWGPHMLVSILHRATGSALTVAGLGLLTWWLVATVSGPDAYATFAAVATSPLGLFVLVGLTWAFFQHMFSGLRHLVMDIGAGFELGTNKRLAIATIVASLTATALLWAYLMRGMFRVTGPKDIGARDRVNVANGKTPLGRVRGLGSAHHGGSHWIHERLTSVALLLLGAWFLASVVMLPSFDPRTIGDWLRSPFAAVPMALFVYLSFAHSLDGMKVIIDDYQGDEGGRLTWHAVSLFVHVGAGALALFALARIALGAQA